MSRTVLGWRIRPQESPSTGPKLTGIVSNRNRAESLGWSKVYCPAGVQLHLTATPINVQNPFHKYLRLTLVHRELLRKPEQLFCRVRFLNDVSQQSQGKQTNKADKSEENTGNRTGA